MNNSKELCLMCGQQMQPVLPHNFYSCQTCDLAIRPESCMPQKTAFDYNRQWLIDEEKKRYNYVRAAYASKVIRQHSNKGIVLDIGCGPGVLVNMLSNAGLSATGVDTSSAAIEYAKETKSGEFCLLEDLDSNTEFDVIAAAHVIEHIREPNSFLEDVRARLKPGGIIYLETPNLLSFSKRITWRKICGGMHGGLDHRMLYTPHSLQKILDDAGFDMVWIRTWTYSTRLYDSLIYALTASFKTVDLGADALSSSGTDNPAKFEEGCDHKKGLAYSFLRKLKSLLRIASGTRVMEWLMWLPNRISEFRDRGVQINCIARLRN